MVQSSESSVQGVTKQAKLNEMGLGLFGYCSFVLPKLHKSIPFRPYTTYTWSMVVSIRTYSFLQLQYQRNRTQKRKPLKSKKMFQLQEELNDEISIKYSKMMVLFIFPGSAQEKMKFTNMQNAYVVHALKWSVGWVRSGSNLLILLHIYI